MDVQAYGLRPLRRMETVIRAENVSKCFSLAYRGGRSFRGLFSSIFNRVGRSHSDETEFWALRDLSFEIGGGESVAFIGDNGAGKSSLLKLITRILEPTSGCLTVQGRVAALLELGAGFHSDLTGRENVFLNGAILGLDAAEITRRFDEIVAFAELERFIDVPVRNYSSGMLVRLGFSVATAFQPDILLVDELLAVGDQAFRSRCMQRIRRIQQAGAMVILVSHDINATRKICPRSIWLDKGRIVADGDTDEVTSSYLKSVWSREGEDALPESEHGKRWGSGEAVIRQIEFLDDHGESVEGFQYGSKFTARIQYDARLRIHSPAFGVAIYREDGVHVTGPNTAYADFPIDDIYGSGTVDYVIDALPLTPGRYEFTAAIYDHYSVHPYDHRQREFSFRVLPSEAASREGVVNIPCRWRHTPDTDR